MTIDTDRLRKAFTVLAEPLPGVSPASWADMKRLCNAAIDAADEIDRLRELLTEARDLCAWAVRHHPKRNSDETLLARMEATLDATQPQVVSISAGTTTVSGAPWTLDSDVVVRGAALDSGSGVS